MDSFSPAPHVPSGQATRPWYLVAAMITTWLIGFHGVTTAYNTAAFLRSGTLPDVASALARVHGGDVMDFAAFFQAVQLEAVSAASATTFPLAVAKALLSAVLVIASGLAMGGRRGARVFALQALLANAALTVLEYLLTRGVRTAWIDALVRAAQTLPDMMPDREAYTNKDVLLWVARLQVLFLNLFGLALGVLVLTRKRTKTYFDAVARLSQHTDNP